MVCLIRNMCIERIIGHPTNRTAPDPALGSEACSRSVPGGIMYRIAGIDLHKMFAVVLSDVAVEGDHRFQW